MASLRFEEHSGRQGWRLQFRDTESRNRSIWLGGEKKHPPTATKEHVEHLLAQTKKGRPPELATSDWLASIKASHIDLYNKLAKCGLVESVEQRKARVLTVAEWCDEYIRERQDVKPATVDSYQKARVHSRLPLRTRPRRFGTDGTAVDQHDQSQAGMQRVSRRFPVRTIRRCLA